jgi:hypothetical protein
MLLVHAISVQRGAKFVMTLISVQIALKGSGLTKEGVTNATSAVPNVMKTVATSALMGCF